jgi:amino acid transporter
VTATAADPVLVRSIGRWSLAAMVLNNIIGTGVFILPGTIGAQLGWMSVVAWIVAALLTVALMLCFAEVASRFTAAGGAYLFTRAAFGPFVGLQIGWLTYFSRAVTAALQANVFATYLAEVWPRAGTRLGSVLATTLFIGFLTAINLRSVRSGARTSTVLAGIKLASLFAFGVLGLIWIAGHDAPTPLPAAPTLGGWLGAILLLLFAYSGYESALIPAGEATNPRRDSPFALFLGLGLVTVVYLAAQITVLATLPDPGATNRPLAASVRAMLGETGAIVISIAALISVYGWLAANLLAAPRLSMAMAERGDLPRVFAHVHPVFRTPWVSILTFGLLSWVLANQAGLLQNLGLSAVSRLFIYGGVCAALPVLRRRERAGNGVVGPALFHAPVGTALAVFCVMLSIVLATRMTVREIIIMLALFVLATLWWQATGRTRVAEGDRVRGLA